MSILSNITKMLPRRRIPTLLLGILSLLTCSCLSADGEAQPIVPPFRELEEIESRTEQLSFAFAPTEESLAPGFSPRYLIAVTGASGTFYDFFIYNLACPNDGLPGTMKGVIEADGYLYTGPDDPSKKGPVSFVMANTSPGETFMCYLVAHDRTAAAMQMITPNPKVVERNGYRISMQLVDPLAEAFLLLVDGCEPHESLTLSSVSCTEFLVPHHIQADLDGRRAIMYSPAVMGEVGGVFTYRVRGDRGGVTLVSPWGEEYKNQVQERPSIEADELSNTTIDKELDNAQRSTARADCPFSLLTEGSRLRVGHFLGSILEPEATLTRLFLPEKLGALLICQLKPHKIPQALAAFSCVAYPFKAQLKKVDRWVI